MNIYSYDGTLIEIEPYENIGLLLSGGLDSSVLLHLLNKANESSHFYIFTMNKEDDSVKHVTELLEYHDFKNNTYERVTIDLHEYGTDEESKGAWAFIKENYWDKIDVLYNANTSPPPEDLDDHFTSRPNYFSRTRSKKALEKFEKFKMPFIDLDKRHTVGLANYFKLNNIIKYSHTCTELAQGSCGECWQCLERQWGFKSHGLTDIGIR